MSKLARCCALRLQFTVRAARTDIKYLFIRKDGFTVKKTIALTLALMLLFTTAAALAEENIYGYEEPITIKVGRVTTDTTFYGGETSTDNSWSKLYADNGILLDIIYDVDSSQGATKLATSIMSGDYPDIISTTLSDYVNYANGEVIADITDLVDRYASDELKQYINSDGGNALECLKVNGRIYGLPKISSTYGSASMLFIRKDWLDNLGLEVPSTMDELKAVAHAFTYDDPDQNGQNDTYGFAFSGVDVVSSSWGDVSLFFDSFGAHIGNGGLAIVEDEQGNVTWGGTNAQGMKDALTLLHDMYVDGSLAKDFLTMTGNNISEEAGGGRCGIFVAPMWGAMNPAWQAIQSDPKAHFITLEIPNAYENVVSKGFLGTSLNGVYCVSSQCEHPEVLIKLMNLSVHYLCHPADTEEYYRYYGDYEKYTGWKLSLTDTLEPDKNLACYQKMGPALETRDTATLNPYELDIYNSLITYIDAVAAGTLNVEDAAFQSPVARYTVYGDPQGAYAAIDKMITDGRWVTSAYNAALTDEQADVSATLKKMTVETIVKIVTGAEPVDYYDAFLKSWMNNGGEDYIADAQAWVDSHK